MEIRKDSNSTISIQKHSGEIDTQTLVLTIILCVLLIFLSLITCLLFSFFRRNYRHQTRQKYSAARNDAPVEKVNVACGKETLKSKDIGDAITEHNEVQRASGKAKDNDYESLKDSSHFYSRLHQSSKTESQIDVIAEVHSGADGQCLELSGEETVHALTQDKFAKSKRAGSNMGSMKSDYEKIRDEEVPGKIESDDGYIDMSNASPKHLNMKTESQHGSLYIDNDDDKEEYVDMGGDKSRYHTVRSILLRKKGRQVDSFYPKNKRRATKNNPK